MSEHQAWQAKHDKYQQIRSFIRPNRNGAKVQPKAVHLPRRGKMKVKAA